MNNPLLIEEYKLSPRISPRASIIECKSRSNSIDSTIMGKAPRVYPQIFTVSNNSSNDPTTQPMEPLALDEKKQKKDKIPKALREQVWIYYAKKHFEIKCPISWCNNKINPFDFHVGHNIPESKGGTLDINNLRPICSRCNLSMGAQYTIEEWDKISKPIKKKKCIIM
jgi:hypothetical protein